MFTYGYKNKKESIIRALICLVVGILLLVFPDATVSILFVRLIGVALTIFGIVELIALVSVMSLVGMGFMTLVLAGGAVLLGVLLIFSPFGQTVMNYIAGVALAWYGASDLISSWKIRQGIDESVRRATVSEPAPKTDDNLLTISEETLSEAKEVDYEKED